MDLNFQHLRYFRAVAHEGSVLRAARILHLAPSTVSAQVRSLEAALGRDLFARVGRNLVLTPFGERVLEQADTIFALGDDLVRFAGDETVRRPLRVGVSSVLPKLMARDLLRRAFLPGVQIQVEEGPADTLLGRLAARRVDVVLSDAGVPSWVAINATSHQLIETGIAVFGVQELYDRVGDDLPGGLERVPWIVPPAGTSLRRGLEAWWERVGIEPDVVAVIDDSALVKALGDAGVGVFAAPATMTEDILASYRVECLGRTDEVLERAFAITREGDPEDPAVRALCGLDAAA